MNVSLQLNKILKIFSIIGIFIISIIGIFTKNIFIVKVLMTILSIYVISTYIKKNKRKRLKCSEILFGVWVLQYIFVYKHNSLPPSINRLAYILEGIIVIAIFFSCLILIIKNGILKRSILFGTSKYIIVYLLYIFLSLLINNVLTLESFFWYIKLFTTFMIIITLIRELSLEQKEKNYFIYFLRDVLLILINLLWIYSWIKVNDVIETTYTGFNRFGGIIIAPVTLSLICGIVLCITIYKISIEENKNFIEYSILVISAISMLFTYGRTGILLGLIGFIGILVMQKGIKKLKVIYILIIIGICLMILYNNKIFNVDLINDIISRGSNSKDLVTINGRIDGWKFAIEAIKNKSILGYGYLSTPKILSMATGSFTEYATVIENSLLLTTLELGLIGLSLILLTIISYIKNVFIYYKESKNIYLIIFGMFFIHSMFSPSFAAPARVLTTIFLYLVLTVNCEQNKSQKYMF